MKHKNHKSALTASGITLLALLLALSITTAHAATWTVTSGNWSDAANWSTNPTIPDGTGITVDYSGATSTLTVDSVRTVGTVTLGGATNGSWTITPTAALTLNQDGVGVGSPATIRNTNTNTGTTNALILGAGTLTLADDLLVSNVVGSTNTSGGVQIGSVIQGSGNVTFSSVAAIPVLNPGLATGGIRLTAANTFTGNVLVQSGAVFVTNGAAFGNSANVIALGNGGAPTVTPYIVMQSAVTIPNDITVGAGTGTTLLGTEAGGSVAGSFTGSITTTSSTNSLFLHSNSGSAAADVGLTVSGVISGPGNLTKIGLTATPGVVSVTGLNTYTGATAISRGILRVTSIGSVSGAPGRTSNLGAPSAGNGTIGMGGSSGFTGTLYYLGTGETTDRDFNLSSTSGGGGTIDSSGTGALITSGGVSATTTGTKPLTLQGSNAGDNAINGNITNGSATSISLTKSGSGKWILGGTNTYTGTTVLSGTSGSILQFNSAAAIGGSGRSVTVNGANSAAAGYAIDQAFLDRMVLSSAGILALGADSSNPLNFTGFTAASLGAIGTFTYSGTLTPNGTTYILGGGGGTLSVSSLLSGPNTLTVTRNGGPTSTVILPDTNTFTGKTTVTGGILSVSSFNSVNGGVPPLATSSLGAPTTIPDGTIDLGASTTSGNLFYTGAGETTDRVINLSGSTGAGLIQSDGTGALIFSSNFTAAAGIKTLFLRGTNTNDNAVNGTISNGSTGTIGIAKEHAGKWILGGANTYGGLTTISGGTLLVNGTHTGGGDYTVSPNATLGGSGSIGSNVIIQAAGHLAPGNSAGFTIGGNLTTTDGVYDWQLKALSTSNPGADFDQVSVGGDLALAGNSMLALDFSLLAGLQPGGGDPFWNSSHSWKIIDTSTNFGSTNFASITGQAGPGTWEVVLGTDVGDIGDVLLKYTVATLMGDVNGDHIVNQLDLNLVFRNWLSTGTPGSFLAQGDANGDGVINQLDINTITGNWLAAGSASGGLAATTVPEPGSSILLVIGIMGVSAYRRRRNSEEA